jgi:hypothetical protein
MDAVAEGAFAGSGAGFDVEYGLGGTETGYVMSSLSA